MTGISDTPAQTVSPCKPSNSVTLNDLVVFIQEIMKKYEKKLIDVESLRIKYGVEFLVGTPTTLGVTMMKYTLSQARKNWGEDMTQEQAELFEGTYCTRVNDFLSDVKTKFCGSGETEKYKSQLRSITQGIKEQVSDYGLRVQVIYNKLLNAIECDIIPVDESYCNESKDKQEGKARTQKRCNHCKKPGHVYTKCWTLAKQMHDVSPGNSNNERNSNNQSNEGNQHNNDNNRDPQQYRHNQSYIRNTSGNNRGYNNNRRQITQIMGTIILIIEMDIEIGPVFKAKILSEIGKMHSTIEDVEFDFEENDCEMLAPRTSSVHQFERAENYEKNDDELCVLLQDDPIPESFESYLKNDLSGSTSSVSNGDGRYEDIIDEK
uniref:CCHC-type domain-containing protein n=1 Tax=Trichogramma kaykai TaxID=54128 RepID=A0ABD2W587_9HYME